MISVAWRTSLWSLASWLQGLPAQAVQQAAHAAPKTDTSQGPALPPLGKDAEVVLRDSLASLPQRAERWLTVTMGAVVRLLPRLVLALIAAAVVIAFTVWVRRILVRRNFLQDTSTHRARIG